MLDRIDDCRVNFRELHLKKPKSEQYQSLHDAAESSWEKCRKYYKLIDSVPAYYAAMIMQVDTKLSWCATRWKNHKDDEIRTYYTAAEKAVKALWLSDYKGQHSKPYKPAASRPVRGEGEEEWTELDKMMHIDSDDDLDEPDALDEYLTSKRIKDRDTLDYAKEMEVLKPDLAAFIYDMAAIPLMSAECERVFSAAKLFITDRRARMKPIVIEAYACLRHWLMATTEQRQFFKPDPPLRDIDLIDQDIFDDEVDLAEDAIAVNIAEEAHRKSSDTDSEGDDDGFTGSYLVADEDVSTL